MSTKELPIVSFLKELMRRRKRLSTQLAADIGVSHYTVSRWLFHGHVPSAQSCQKIAKYSNVPLLEILSMTGYIPRLPQQAIADWPEFRDYASQKYPDELDEDIITMIEDYIEQRRAKKHGRKNP